MQEGIRELIGRVVDQPLSRELFTPLILIQGVLKDAVDRIIQDDGSSDFRAVRSRDLIARTGQLFRQRRDFILELVGCIDKMHGATISRQGVDPEVVKHVQGYLRSLYEWLNNEPKIEGGEEGGEQRRE